jgi:formylglycine-generating enzyme required for sulfatase activity
MKICFEGTYAEWLEFASRHLKEAAPTAPGIPIPEMVDLSSMGMDLCFGKYPVTFAEYDAFCEATDREKPYDNGWGRVARPVINVDFFGAAQYCAWLSGHTGDTYRLPTEEEWETACRAEGSQQNMWSFGSNENLLKGFAWYSVNSGGKTRQIGKRLPNKWGLHDMHGNVWEWTDSLFSKGRAARVVRGGSWGLGARYCRCASRYGYAPDVRYGSLGFRCVREVKHG